MLGFALLLLAATPEPVLPLMPMPARVSMGQGSLSIDSSFGVTISGYRDQRIESAARRLVARISKQTGIPMRGEGGALVVECGADGPENPSLGEDESYRLDVSPTGAHIHAPNVTGALRGMATFAQLVAPGADSFIIPAGHIEDKPRFPWRGLMMDVSRHWFPVPVIERNLDAMASVKLNVFHWHLSDDQGFRVESKLYPRLHQFGSDGKFYTQDQVRHVVAYARDRGIRVVPEFDMPGHTTSWFAGYPELASAPGPYRIERRWGIFEPTMDPTREGVYTFLDGFIGEMSRLFPDEYFHIGGDEVMETQWKENRTIQAFCQQHGLQTGRDLQAYFNKRIQPLVKKHGKKMVGWDEVLQPDLAPDTVIQSWRGQASLAEAAQKGYRGILSFGYYLDHLKPAAFHYMVDPAGLGGEACMWAEYVSAETVDSRIWPRAAVIAERLWSPREVRDVESMYRRMTAASGGLDWVGVEHRRNYRPMLERLAGGHSTEDLQVLVDAVEALGIEHRAKARPYTSGTPLNRLVDAARPESEIVRVLEAAARGNDAAAKQQLRSVLVRWRENHARLLPTIQGSFLLRETLPLSEDLARLGAIGLQALDYAEAHRQAPEVWIRQQKELLGQMERPRAEEILAAVRPVRILVENTDVRSGNERVRNNGATVPN